MVALRRIEPKRNKARKYNSHHSRLSVTISRSSRGISRFNTHPCVEQIMTSAIIDVLRGPSARCEKSNHSVSGQQGDRN